MHRRMFPVAAFASLALVGRAWAEGGDSAAVLAANKAFEEALSRRDLAAVDSMWLHADHVVAIHPSGRPPLFGWEAVRKSWMESFERFSEFLVETTEPKPFVVGDMARVVGVERFRGTMAGNGNKVEFLAATTNLWERHGREWLLTLHHASRMVA